MTFRILPGSILNIATYPFIPPTTLSGFLRRLGMMSVGLDIPETCVNGENPPVFVLPSRYVSLGAYPTASTWSGVHRTYRKGMREFNHDFFSRLYQAEDKANFQLHTWEYFIAEELEGYVVAETAEELEPFRDLECYGCKLGKEGFAVVTKVSEVTALEQKTIAAMPSTLVPMEALLQSNQFIGGYDIYNLYRYQWAVESPVAPDSTGFLDKLPTLVDGFVPFVTAYFPKKLQSPPNLDYYTSSDIHIPVSLVDLLKGEAHA